MSELVKTAPAALALDTRTCWPADLRLLIDRYPRDVWEGHANLGAMARFWLQRHDMFREIAGALDRRHHGVPRRDGERTGLPRLVSAAPAVLPAAAQRAPSGRGPALFPGLPGRRGKARARLHGARGRSRDHPRVDRRDGRERQRLPARRDQRRGRAARGRRRLHGVERKTDRPARPAISGTRKT